MRYANFSPFGSPTIPYYLRREDWTYCYDLPPFGGATLGAAMDYVNAMAVLATRSIPVYNVDFKVDVMFLSGRILLKNPDGSPITIGNATEYHVAGIGTGTTAQAFYDFDGDGKSDRSVVGDIKDDVQPDGTVKKIFFEKTNGPYQGVYFSSQTKADGTPNVIRLADKGDRLKPNGLLKSISKDDLKNTDIYVFRESTGQLVLERNGLKDEEVAGRVDIGLGKDDQYYYYRLMLRGPMDNQLNIGGINRSKNWEEWAEEYRLAEPFRKRESDHLKSGEWVRLVVINRATGYMGTQRIQLGDASKNTGSMLSVKLDDTWLQPPNLKIWAERDYTQTSGLEQNKQQKNNIIGMEGASLDSDDIIRVYTEWLDEEGRPLPEGLSTDNGEQYGLTGRLAKIGAPNQLVGVAAGSLASFAIAPGMNTQVLRLKDNLTTPEHFYVHVVGEQKDESPDFGTDPTEAPPLDTRPKNATPFLVPIYDENKHWQTWSAWNQLKRAYDAEELDEEPLKPKGSYVWHVRPEYQFSQFALEIQKIEREYTTESGETNTQELLVEQEDEGKIPTIRANDDLVRVFYSLIGNSNNPLLPIDGEQELVFGFGASEVRATIGANGEIVFKDLSHIDSLDPTDLLTLRLYVNHDAGNTLWEWAFTRNGLHVYYSIPGNTQLEQNRSLQNISDAKCSNNVCEDIEILGLLAPEDTGYQPTETPKAQPEVKVRTLGGMRLRYRYIAPSLQGVILKKVTWTIGYKGRYCPDYGLDTTNCKERDAGQAYEQEASFMLPGITPTITTYWEPLNGNDEPDWSNWAGTETDDKGISALLEAEYTIPVSMPNGDTPTSKVLTRRFEQPFTVNTRELKPATGTEKPMQGSDVAMLEAMLWQFGISPQKGRGYDGGSRAGISGWRINSHMLEKDKKGNVILNEHTKNCDGSKADKRDIYIGGWDNCSRLNVSLEGMVRRFQGRNVSARAGKEVNAGASADGIVNNVTLVWLQRVWSQYVSMTSHSDYKSRTQILAPAVTDEWLDQALFVWDDGFKLPDGTILAEKTYTDDEHKKMLAAAGLSESAKNRRDLLRKWKMQEAPSHWGQGKPATQYRMTEGGGDEFGSMSFNQILFKFRYSDAPCTGHQKSKLNFYDPVQNIKAFGLHLATKGTNCPGAFDAAYVNKTLGKNNPTDVIHYRHDSGAWKPIPAADDAYDIFSKALAGYNAGTGFGSSVSWSEWIKRTRKPKDGDGYQNRLDGACFSCLYTLQVKNEKYGLPYRTYRWKGGKNPADMPILDADGNPELESDDVTQKVHPDAGKDWCFAYGESEWMSGENWAGVKQKASPKTARGVWQTPVGQINCN